MAIDISAKQPLSNYYADRIIVFFMIQDLKPYLISDPSTRKGKNNRQIHMYCSDRMIDKRLTYATPMQFISATQNHQQYSRYVLISVTDTILTYHTKDTMILHEIVSVKQFSRLPTDSLENKLFYNNQEVVLLSFLNQQVFTRDQILFSYCGIDSRDLLFVE